MDWLDSVKPHAPNIDLGKSSLNKDSVLFHVDNTYRDQLRAYAVYCDRNPDHDSTNIRILKIIPADSINSTWVRFENHIGKDNARLLWITAIGINGQESSAEDVGYKIKKEVRQ
jgi:hypothetical protein